MRRILVLLTVVAMMVVMMAMAASSAMAVRVPPPPSPGEPILSGGPRNLVLHCGPFFEPILGVEVHGALGGQGGNCVIAPPPQ
jgi:hypothetical protein